MHFANSSPRSLCRAVCVALAGAVGRYFWHWARAVRNAGALSETPLTDKVSPLPWMSIPLSLRSGKFGTPLARMQLENPSVEPFEMELLPVEALAPAGEVVRLAAVESAGALEPHAAIVVTAASAATALRSRIARDGRVRWLYIGLLPRCPGGCGFLSWPRRYGAVRNNSVSVRFGYVAVTD